MALEPLLTKFSVARTEGLELPGSYDDTRQVWVVNSLAGTLPIIESTESGLAELSTKTDAVPERDDARFSSFIELETKTMHQLEREDVDPRISFLELITVTKIGSERPDI